MILLYYILYQSCNDSIKIHGCEILAETDFAIFGRTRQEKKAMLRNIGTKKTRTGMNSGHATDEAIDCRRRWQTSRPALLIPPIIFNINHKRSMRQSFPCKINSANTHVIDIALKSAVGIPLIPLNTKNTTRFIIQ